MARTRTTQPTVAERRRWVTELREATSRYAETWRGDKAYRNDRSFRAMVERDHRQLCLLIGLLERRWWARAAETMSRMDTMLRDQIPATVYERVNDLAGWT